MYGKTVYVLAACAIVCATATPAYAVPIFAQRYHLRCDVCHRVLPELNAFGDAFRDRGYRLPLRKGGTTVAALRYQMEWDRDPANGTRRFFPGAIALANADIGRIAAFVHYNFGAQGGPAGLYLGYLATYGDRSRTLWRLGQFELPLSHSPGQRLDDLAPYGYESTHVGLNDLTLSAPRIGLEAERSVGVSRLAATLAVGEFKGAAYGGAPLPTGESTFARRPEVGLYARLPFAGVAHTYAQTIVGTRAIVQTGKPAFSDAYQRYGIGVGATFERYDILAQQWWGRDTNADGFGSATGSSGGFMRVRYFLGAHAFVGARFDAAANPIASRATVLYASTTVGRHARFLIEERRTMPQGRTTLEGAFTIALPWPKGL